MISRKRWRHRNPSIVYVRTIVLLSMLLAGLFLVNIGSVFTQDDPGVVYIAEIRGIINPPVADYLDRTIDKAQEDGAVLVVVKLDTPGGLDTSMRRMNQAILNSRVPVAVYVEPTGARAASAGLFLLMASHVAAMAPGTNTGAASPVSLGGGDTNETAAAKAVNDAAATIRALATQRGRNAEWAELAVRESVSITAEEALETNVIDVISPSIDQLLQDIDGWTITTIQDEKVVLTTADANRRDIDMTLAERLLHVISDPNIAFVLLSVGSLGLLAELFNPGALIPGITGVIALIMAFFALGNLPTNWAGVALIVLAAVLLVAELSTDTTGVLATGGLIAFVLGGLILYRPLEPGSPALPDLRVDPRLLGGMLLVLVAFVFLVLGQIIRARFAPVLTGSERFVGQIAEVHKALQPEGRVWFQGQAWFARTESGQPISTGEPVRIVELDGLTLIVEPDDERKPKT